MPLPQAKTRIPTSIGRTRFEIIDFDGTNVLREIVAYAQVLDQNENEMARESWEGSLIPYMTSEELLWLGEFLDKYRAMAVSDILP